MMKKNQLDRDMCVLICVCARACTTRENIFFVRSSYVRINYDILIKGMCENVTTNNGIILY